MSSRPSVYVSLQKDSPEGKEPNRYRGGVTVDLRVFYPPNAESVDIALTALAEAYIEATEELQARRSKGAGLPPEERNT